jgi:hypothetical protein
MTDTTFVAQETRIVSTWLNDVNRLVYDDPFYRTEINVLRYVPRAQWAGILAGTSTYDARAAFQEAIDTKKPLYAPGIYRIVGSLNFANLLSLRGDGTNGGSSQGSGAIFESTGTAPAATVPAVATRARTFCSITDFFFKASSWDATTGALGHGLDISSQVSLDRVQVIGFKKLGIYMHHDATQNGPYQSTFTNVKCLYNGQHGLVVGRGANAVTIINAECKWNGAPAWLTAPSVLSVYDGLYCDNYDDGSGWPSYLPEGLSIIGGDFSYNSRYGYNIQGMSYGRIMPGYSEFNLAAFDAHLGLDLQNCFVQLGRTPVSKVDLQATFASYQRNNTVMSGGRHLGAGNTNTAPQNSFFNSNLTTYFTEDPTQTKLVAMVPTPANGDAVLAGFGGGILTLGSGAAVTLPISANIRFDGLNTTGAGAALLGANSPATVLAAPYKWIRVLAADGTVCFMPIWK